MYRHLVLNAFVLSLIVFAPVTALSQPTSKNQLTQTDVSTTVQPAHHGDRHGDYRGGRGGCWW